MEAFTKPALSLADQLNLLKDRGLVVSDHPRALRYLQFIGYYRLMAYARPYQMDNSHTFVRGTTFDDILSLYIFDRKIRLHTMDAIERLEVALRTAINHYMSLQYDQFWIVDPSNFSTSYEHAKLVRNIDKSTRSGIYPFYIAYFKKYNSPSLPPSWMITETLSLGQWSLMFANLKRTSDQKAIANVFNLPYMTFKSWLRSLTTIRNICAHHGLVWNRSIPYPPRLSAQFDAPDPDHYFARVIIIWQLLSIVTRKSNWLTTLKQLLLTCPRSISEMGFPADWQALAYW